MIQARTSSVLEVRPAPAGGPNTIIRQPALSPPPVPDPYRVQAGLRAPHRRSGGAELHRRVARSVSRLKTPSSAIRPSTSRSRFNSSSIGRPRGTGITWGGGTAGIGRVWVLSFGLRCGWLKCRLYRRPFRLSTSRSSSAGVVSPAAQSLQRSSSAGPASPTFCGHNFPRKADISHPQVVCHRPGPARRTKRCHTCSSPSLSQICDAKTLDLMRLGHGGARFGPKSNWGEKPPWLGTRWSTRRAACQLGAGVASHHYAQSITPDQPDQWLSPRSAP